MVISHLPIDLVASLSKYLDLAREKHLLLGGTTLDFLVSFSQRKTTLSFFSGFYFQRK